MACVCCGRDGIPTFSIPSHVGTLKACASCHARFGSDELGLEADRLLTDFYMGQKPAPVCPICKAALILYPDGSVPMWCSGCEGKRRELVRQYA